MNPEVGRLMNDFRVQINFSHICFNIGCLRIRQNLKFGAPFDIDSHLVKPIAYINK